MRKTPRPRKLKCRKRARRCGAKRVPKSKCLEHFSLETLLAGVLVQENARFCAAKHFLKSKMSKTRDFGNIFGCRKCQKKCWCDEQILKSECAKQSVVGTLLEVEMLKVYAVVARSTFPNQNCKHSMFGPF